MANKTSFKLFDLKNLRPERLFLTIGIFMGVLLCFFLPYGVGIDENFALVRIFDISSLNLVPNRPSDQGNYSLSQFNTLSYMSGTIRNSAASNFSPEIFWQKPNWSNMDSVYTTSTYFPFLYLPQALIAGISWRLFDFPILPVVILMRLIGLALYLAAGYFTLRLLPFGKWVFFVLALAPQPLYQASTLNGDWFTNASCFLFIGAVLYVFNKRDKPITLKDSWLLAGTTLLVGLAKPATIILLPLLLILLRKKPVSRKSLFIVLGGVILALGISLGWSFYYFLGTVSKVTGESRSSHILLALNNLGDFLPMYFRNLAMNWKLYFTEWVGVYKYWRGEVPAAVYILFVIALTTAFFTNSKNEKFPVWLRVLVSVFAIGILLAYASETVLLRYSPGEQRYEAQGRYLVEFAPLLFLVWPGMFTARPRVKKYATGVLVSLVILLLGIYGYGAYRTFYSVCLHAVNKNSACVLPLYWDLDVQNPQFVTLDDQTTVSQSFTPTCARISNIQLRVDPPAAHLKGEVHLSIFAPSGNVERSVSLPAADWQRLEQITLPFDPLEVTPGQEYSLKLNWVTNDPSSSMNLLAIPKDDYTLGQLTVDGSASAQFADLFFEYECVR